MIRECPKKGEYSPGRVRFAPGKRVVGEARGTNRVRTTGKKAASKRTRASRDAAARFTQRTKQSDSFARESRRVVLVKRRRRGCGDVARPVWDDEPYFYSYFYFPTPP